MISKTKYVDRVAIPVTAEMEARGNVDMYRNAVMAEQREASISAFYGRRQQREFIKCCEQNLAHPYLAPPIIAKANGEA